MGIEYDGSAYQGWQRQRNGTGVQAVLERALSGVADEAVETFCAGRTDAGVHALSQVVHFDTSSARTVRGWLLGTNSNLPDDISVSWVHPVSDDFHARYSATARTYRYVVLNRLVRSALFRLRAWWVYEPLDVGRMQAAGDLLLGEHDFSAFRAAGCQASTPMRNVMHLAVSRDNDWITVTITANAFLQHMVRNIVGLLVAVGSGGQPPQWAAAVLESRDRKQGAVTAPAHGLTLVHVDYPAHFGLPLTSPQQHAASAGPHRDGPFL